MLAGQSELIGLILLAGLAVLAELPELADSHKYIYISGLLKPLGVHPHSCPYRNFGSTSPTPPPSRETQGGGLFGYGVGQSVKTGSP